MVSEIGIVIGGLRLLLEGYKLAKERLGDENTSNPDPQKLEEVIADVETSAEANPAESVDVNQEIDRKFNPEQAAKIKSDLSSLALLTDPPAVEEFRYWATLKKVANSFQEFARKLDLFELRGTEHRGSRYLYLDKTRAVIVPTEHIEESLTTSGRAYGKGISRLNAYLAESDAETPLTVGVAGFLKMATIMGEQYQEKVGAVFSISEGAARNRLRFTPDTGSGYFTVLELRVTADEITKTINAIKDDLANYALEIANERDSARRLSVDVSEIIKDLSDLR
jgi:hypothetical protein